MSLDLKAFATNPVTFAKALMIPTGSGLKKFGDCMADCQHERFRQIKPALLAIANGEKPPIGRYWWEGSRSGSTENLAQRGLITFVVSDHK